MYAANIYWGGQVAADRVVSKSANKQLGADRTGPAEPAASPEWRYGELHYTILWWFYSKLTIRRSSSVDCHQAREKWKNKRRLNEYLLCFPVTFPFHIWMLCSAGRL